MPRVFGYVERRAYSVSVPCLAVRNLNEIAGVGCTAKSKFFCFEVLGQKKFT